MKHVQFVISNDRHHAAMMLAVAGRLVPRPGYRCSLLSLCEFRGLRTPVERFRESGVEVKQVLRTFSRPNARRQGGVGARRLRGLARRLSWELLLGPRLRRRLADRPDVVVLPNDAAFPYGGLAALLRSRSIPFLLLQEGIRFPLPAESGEDRYGSGGAAALAAWGEGSAEHFRALGVPAERIHVTGNPRFDGIKAFDWAAEAERVSRSLGLPGRFLLLLSNPIDDQGFCSSAEKLGVLRAFVERAAPVLEARGVGLVVKLHGRESASDTEAALSRSGVGGRLQVLNDAPLYPLLEAAAGAVVLASSVGLEAMLFGVPVGVLEIPGHGFVHDYVARGAAVALPRAGELGAGLELLLDPPAELTAAAARYLSYHLALDGDAAGRVARLVEGLAAT